MGKRLPAREITTAGAFVLLGSVPRAWATQVHAAPEGLFAHQIAHFFFLFSMGILIYWLRERRLVREPGWRHVQYAALFLILWNLDAVAAHYLDGREDLFEVINAGSWNAFIQAPAGSTGWVLVYYLVKLDHLLCVPAIVLLYLGLKRLLLQARESRVSN